MTTYVMQCGCRLEKEELHKIKNGTYRCPHHPEKMVATIERPCLDCGKILVLTPRQGGIIRCPECQAESLRARSVVSTRKHRGKKDNLEVKKMDLSLYTQGLDRYLK